MEMKGRLEPLVCIILSRMESSIYSLLAMTARVTTKMSSRI